MGKKNQARLRLAVDNDRNSSGRNCSRGTPESFSTSITRSNGTPPFLRHLCIACGEIRRAFDKAPMPPDCFMTCSMMDIARSQPQVELRVNLPLVAALNRRLHPYGMSPLGKTITARLKSLDQTQAWLAEQCSVSEQAVSKWIATGKVSRANAMKAAKALDMTVTQLLDPTPTPELDERWHSFPPSVKLRVLALVDELLNPPAPGESRAKPRRRA